jgi:flagellar motor switch protein FliN/FliY
MTILPDTTPLSAAATDNAAALADAAAAAAALLPAAAPLTAADPTVGNLASALGFAGAAIASFEGTITGSIAVLVGPDLVEALAASPLGSLDLAAAAQPALDAAAEALMARVGAARTVPTDLVLGDLGAPFTVVPLVGAGSGAALLINDAALESAAAHATAAAAASAAASAHAGPLGSSPTLGAVASAGAGFTPTAFGQPVARGLEILHGVVMDVTVELGRARMSVRELLALAPGTVLELDRAAGSPADLLVNGRLIARGEVVVVDEDFGLRVTEIVDDSATS